MHTPNPNIPNIPNTPDVGMPLSSGPAQPVVLFPVRLETRFFRQANGASELRVRVYPDKIHVASHDPGLSADEVIWGQHFWEQTWLAGNDEERAKSAWQQLADRFDPPRAAWIAHSLKPLNPEDRPANPVERGQSLSNPIRFPTPATEPQMRTPETQVLPSFWVVLGYKDEQLVINAQGSSIRDPLAVGPAPHADGTDPATHNSDDPLEHDEEMKWIVDFKVAEEVGMGIRIKLTEEIAASGFDFLLVMGIKDTPGGTTDATTRLAKLFDAHHYTDGLGFVAQGTPTNNTQDAPSGFSSKDLGYEESYQSERITPVFQFGDGSNADVLTTALGLTHAEEKASHIFANIPNAAPKESLDARHMNTALWQATWGYFLRQMLGVGGPANENPLTDEDIAWARSHFIDYVRAGGPLPALRVGKQPYGVLPVTSLNAWKPKPGQEDLSRRDVALRDFLIKLRDLWRLNYPDVPRLGRSGNAQESNIDQDLAEVFSMDGISSSYSIRNLMGRQYLQNLLVFLTADFFSDVWGVVPQTPQQWAALINAQNLKRRTVADWWVKQEELVTKVLKTLEVTWRPRLAHALFAPHVAVLNGPLVQANPSPFLSPNYIESLLAARDLDAIYKETIQQPPPRALIYLLLRHSMLLEYVAVASHLQALPPELRREPELIGFPISAALQTFRQQMETIISVPGLTEQIELGKYLLGFLPSGEPDVDQNPDLKPLSEYRASLGYLKTVPVARLEQLLTGTLDLCSHRLDAWITSFATKRLAEIRKSDLASVLIGGYGWVMNLKRADAQAEVVPPPAGEQSPVYQLGNNPGLIHAPSLTQATTAAVLRSGHLAHSTNQMSSDLLAIDLSSERVRLATWLLDGVRQGQPLGALLGYRFERRLEEAGEAQFISSFRELAPLVARKLEVPAPTQAVENIAANNVVDGLMLNTLWQKTQQELDPSQREKKEQDFFLKLLQADERDKQKVRTELMALHDAVDAVSDALLAESVYQVVRGNPLRAASTVESIAGGETPPPELEVVRTPRSGIALTHRLVTLFSGDPVLPSHWAPPPIPLRANAEPHLNAWVANLLGNPARVRCIVERVDPNSSDVLEKEVRLSELGLAPLDFIYAVEGGSSGLEAEIEQRILYRIQRRPDHFPVGSVLRINPSRKPEWRTDELSYGEFSELLRTARKLITGARGIDGDDLNLPERNTNSGVDVEELVNRANAADGLLLRTTNDLRSALMETSTPNAETLRNLLMRAAAFGLPGAVPLSALGDTSTELQTLIVQAESIHRELAQRDRQLRDLASRSSAGTATDDIKRNHAIEQLRIIFGKEFVVLPRFTATNAAELEKALADSVKLQENDPLASTTWFQRMAHVRDGVARQSDTLSYAEALGNPEALKLTIAQLPYIENDRWVGLPLEEGQRLPGGKLSLAVQSTEPIDPNKSLAGLLIDEWVEVVPNPTETTGIAFQYDQPNTVPPQTILIAVPPEMDVPWTVWSLQQVLLETLDLARTRAVDPDALDQVGHYLPALYFAININDGDTVSTDFTQIK